MADDAAGLAAKAGEAGDDRGIVAEIAVAVDLRELLEEKRCEIKGVGPLGMPGDERFLPRSEVRINLGGEFGKLLLQLGDLRVSAGLSICGGELFDLTPELQDGLFEIGEVAVHEPLTLTQMNSMLATDPAVTTDEKPVALAPLETWAGNERMRHIPSADWMARKVDGDLRRRIDLVLSIYRDLGSADPRHDALQNELRSLCKSLEKLSEAAKPGRHANGSHDVAAKIESLLAEVAANLRALETTPYGRRYPYHFFEKSKAEFVYSALLAAICHAERIIPLARAIDGGIDERLLEGLVVLQNPVDERMLKPIA